MKEREILNLSTEDAQEIVWEESEDFMVIEDKVTSTGRWSSHHKLIVKRNSDGKFFISHYTKGLTEQQDQSPYEYDTPIFAEVIPYQKTIIDYKWED